MSWRNCTFRDTSSGALMLGGLDTCDEKDASKWDRDFVIADSSITNMPVEYTGATAVFFGCESGLQRVCYLRCCPSLPLSVPCWLHVATVAVVQCLLLPVPCWLMVVTSCFVFRRREFDAGAQPNREHFM